MRRPHHFECPYCYYVRDFDTRPVVAAVHVGLHFQFQHSRETYEVMMPWHDREPPEFEGNGTPVPECIDRESEAAADR